MLFEELAALADGLVVRIYFADIVESRSVSCEELVADPSFVVFNDMEFVVGHEVVSLCH